MRISQSGSAMVRVPLTKHQKIPCEVGEETYHGGILNRQYILSLFPICHSELNYNIFGM
jgi:hypothetical protein